MSLFAGKTTATQTFEDKYLTGYNPAEFVGIEPVETKNGTALVIQVKPISKQGDKSERSESIYLTTTKGDVQTSILNQIIKAADPANQELADGTVLTEEIEAYIMSLKGMPCSLLMYKQASKDGKMYHNTNGSGTFKLGEVVLPCIEHVAKANTLVDIPDQKAKTTSNKQNNDVNSANGNNVLR